ncbi:hypothetical protein O2N63_17030 [Aliiroseovarius sp. KMU-50]|uniref:Helix-turn-helix domain-containing protein n=1 Tax=Aliiroseovarius salicola TaxID=3009082 RepID=A0ABT4W5K2_9RHOB|nr:helix-turn-helix domain-containing protein [Aliiroseovarius sp. KMU-50]MDA5095797.1 hypothetical protein [Aliiroseovarius sp. KMU-50]
MTKRKPLDLLNKWQVAQYWVRQQPQLTRSGFLVLMRLLDRQNPKTGRCDPSAIGLLEEIGLSERGVRGAFKELEKRGALKRYRSSRRARNQFLIFSPEELEQMKQLANRRKKGTNLNNGLQTPAFKPATPCRSSMKQAAPETIKETIKKKENAENWIGLNTGSNLSASKATVSDMGLGEFERRVVKVFEKEGFGYSGLLMLPNGALEQVHADLVSGCKTFSQALEELLTTYRETAC